jgi:hypothetical protein
MYCILPLALGLHEMDLSRDPAAAHPLSPYAGERGRLAASRHGGASSDARSTPSLRDALLIRHEAGCTQIQETAVGKYLVGWVLGVPTIVLALLYIFFR